MSMTDVWAVLPNRKGTPVEILIQEIEGVRSHFSSSNATLHFACRPESFQSYQAILPDVRLEAVPTAFSTSDEVLILEGYDIDNGYESDWDAAARATQAGARTSTIKFTGRIYPHERRLDHGELQNMDSHVFNRLSPEEPGSFYFFPHGYLYRFTGMGPIDAFGFRITRSVRDLSKRPKNHKVVACFGGSAGWSMYCLHHQMYTEVIERELNRRCKERNLDLTFTVLNFGQHGHMVEDEMLTYLSHCWELKPDIVIAHDGYNDLVYGQLCDPRLLDGWNMTYQENFEGWAQALHQTSALPRTQNQVPYRAVNLPVQTLRAYTARKRQFAHIAQSNGSFFVWGLQSAACSRKHKSKLEISLLERNLNRDYAPVVQNVEGLYRILGQSLRLEQDIPFVNCHEAFGNERADQWLIGDDVHLMPAGDELVGKLYANCIDTTYLETGRWRP